MKLPALGRLYLEGQPKTKWMQRTVRDVKIFKTPQYIRYKQKVTKIQTEGQYMSLGFAFPAFRRGGFWS